MRAAAYARVSSSAQRERDTIASQLRVLPAYIAAQGWTLVGPYIDDGLSAATGASKLDAREGFARLVRDADARRFDVLVVVDIDRLTRTNSLEERALILGPFQRNNIQIVTPNGGALDLRTMLGELYITMQALVAAEDNRKRSERVAQGKLTAAQRGRKVGRGPYGLTYNPKSGVWSPDPVRAPVVLEVFERAAAGESCGSLAPELAARGVPPPGRAGWVKGRVRDLLRSRHPAGEWIAHRATRTAVSVPAIVSEELWQAAQAALDRGRKRGLRRTRHIYLLEGLARCGACGGPMRIRSANVTRGRWLRPAAYRCANWGAGGCAAPSVLTADADARTWAAVCSIVDDRELPGELAAVRAARAADVRDWDRDAAGYRAHLARLDKVKAALLVRFRRGSITEIELDQELLGLNREQAAVRGQLAGAERARGSVATARERLGAATALVERLRASMAAATPVERRAITTTMIDPGGVTFAGQALRIEMFVDRPGQASGVVDAESCSSVRESRMRIRVVA